MRTVPNFKVLEQIPSKNMEGEKVLVEDEHKIYEWTDIDGWVPTKDTETGVTLYDLNKIACAQLPPLTDELLATAKKNIKNFIVASTYTYYLMICKDLSYYTMFVMDPKSEEEIDDVVVECLQCLGHIVSIEFPSNQVMEAWVKDDEGNASLVFMTPYDQGVVKCRK